MAKQSNGAVAPKERINIVYRPATGNKKEVVEIPFKVVVLGDFTKRDDDRTMEEREPVEVNKSNFNDVMASMDLSADVSVPNKLSDKKDAGDISVTLNFKSMRDFEPGAIIDAVPELKEMLELRDALKALKGPLGNVPAMRKTIMKIVKDEKKAAQLMKELGLKK